MTGLNMMFGNLNSRERAVLTRKLFHAGRQLYEEAGFLAGAPAPVLAVYGLPRGGYHDFYDAAIEAAMLSVEVHQSAPRFVPTGTGWPVK